jgi:hypothetical protein
METDRRAALNAAMIAATVINSNPFRGANSKPVTPLDFLPPDRDARPHEQTLDEQIALLTAVFGCGPGKPI